MPARILPPTPETINEAAALLRNGHLAAFPTETVYGLGANALDAAAVAQIFAAKGRPQTNPVIVHVPNADAARFLVREWPIVAQKLTHAFWPGPLTLILPKSEIVPDIVTANGQTVGVRVPAHPVALELLRAAQVPLAAPSANRSEAVSPTLARHVAESLGEYVPDLLVLDGGPCRVGLESTVLDITSDVPHILRPGMVTAQMLRETIGAVWEGGPHETNPNEASRSPGQMLRHYAPRAPVVLVPSDAVEAAVGSYFFSHERSGLLFWNDREMLSAGGRAVAKARVSAALGSDPVRYAAKLYAALRDMDEWNVARIVIEEPPRTPEWAAVHDRLRRAAAKASESTQT